MVMICMRVLPMGFDSCICLFIDEIIISFSKMNS